MTRNEQILALRGFLSYGLIAKRLGISRNVVAGVCFRADWPSEKRVTAKKGRWRTCSGTGRRGGGKHAAWTERHERFFEEAAS